MQIYKCVEEVRDASTDVEEVDNSVVEVEVQTIRHFVLKFTVQFTIFDVNTNQNPHLNWGSVTSTKIIE